MDVPLNQDVPVAQAPPIRLALSVSTDGGKPCFSCLFLPSQCPLCRTFACRGPPLAGIGSTVSRPLGARSAAPKKG